MYTVLYMASRLLLGSLRDRVLRNMMAVSFGSIVIGAAACCLVDAIMRGLEQETRGVLRRAQPDIIARRIRDGLLPRVQALLPDAHIMLQQGAYGLLSTEQGAHLQPVGLIGVDADRAGSVIAFYGGNWMRAVSGHTVALGSSLAKGLSVAVGDQIQLLYVDEHRVRTNTNRVNLAREWLTVGSIFTSGVDDIDQQTIVAVPELLEELFGDACTTQLAIRVADESSIATAMTKLKSAFSEVEFYAWYDLYPTLLAALTLERYGMLVIMALIALVAAMNLFALIYVYSTTKLSTLVMLQALGMAPRSVVRMVYYLGLLLVFMGTSGGIVVAVLAAYLLNRYQLISLPDIYYVSYLPAHIDYVVVLMLCAGSLLVGFCVVYWATKPLRTTALAQVIKELS